MRRDQNKGIRSLNKKKKREYCNWNYRLDLPDVREQILTKVFVYIFLSFEWKEREIHLSEGEIFVS